MSEPAISVIVPFRDLGALLREAAESVLSQSFGDFELILADDGSTEEDASIADQIAASDGRVRVLHLQKRGVSAARNAALESAKGRFVAFVDADDTVEKEYLSDLITHAEATDADYVVAPYTISLEDGSTREVALREQYGYSTNGEIRKDYLPRIFGYGMNDVKAWYKGVPLFSKRETAGVWRGLFRKSVIDDNNIRFDESITLYEDAMFLSAFLLKAKSMTSTSRPLYRYRLRKDGSMLGKANRERLVENKLALLNARAALDAAEGGSLSCLYDATCVLSLVESLRHTALHPSRRNIRALCGYMRNPTARIALKSFPLSLRHPLLATAVSALRIISLIVK